MTRILIRKINNIKSSKFYKKGFTNRNIFQGFTKNNNFIVKFLERVFKITCRKSQRTIIYTRIKYF